MKIFNFDITAVHAFAQKDDSATAIAQNLELSGSGISIHNEILML